MACLDKLAIARLAALVVHCGDYTLPFAQAQTRYLVPITPIGEGAILGSTRLLALGLSWACHHPFFSSATCGSIQCFEKKLVGLFLRNELAAPDRRMLATTTTAIDGSPFRPCAKHVLFASACAIRHLLRTPKIAWLAAMIRQSRNGAVPRPLSTASNTIAPRGPVAPCAIFASLVFARLCIAMLCNHQLVIAWNSTKLRRLQDLSLAFGLTTPTCGCAV
mmetsp:Transcript_93195/g.268273  ORF Transcript_93195/g.268273 Transcript_93195/m.268273 type:complete len:220 (+) Transcript_93195:2489-3148(+)